MRYGYAIVREDRYIGGWYREPPTNRIKIKRVVWDEGLAQREVERLNLLNGDDECEYFYQMTRVDFEETEQ
jgi:hypothetical protein